MSDLATFVNELIASIFQGFWDAIMQVLQAIFPGLAG
jgi:hypothetical protein